MKEGQRNNQRFWILFIGLLALVIGYSTPALAQEAAPLLDKAEVRMEREIIQEVEVEKEAQLQEYFREYYYKQGIVYYKKGNYQEAMAKFKRALHWAPEYEPVLRYIRLIEEKTGQKYDFKEEKIPTPEKLTTPEVISPEVSGIAITYRIDKEDVLEISVWRHPELLREVIVRPDGMISFPLVGDMPAVGKTLTQLDEELTKSLSSYVKEPQISIMVESFGWKKEVPEEVFLEENPEVSVMIKKFGGKKVVVLGDVAKPGVYTYTGDIRLIETLALAGDCTKYAVKNNILIIRGDIHSNPTVISSNMLAFLKNAKLSENVLIQPQDVIFVPRSLIGNINAFIETITPIVDMVYKGSTTKTTVENF